MTRLVDVITGLDGSVIATLSLGEADDGPVATLKPSQPEHVVYRKVELPDEPVDWSVAELHARIPESLPARPTATQ